MLFQLNRILNVNLLIILLLHQISAEFRLFLWDTRVVSLSSQKISSLAPHHVHLLLGRHGVHLPVGSSSGYCHSATEFILRYAWSTLSQHGVHHVEVVLVYQFLVVRWQVAVSINELVGFEPVVLCHVLQGLVQPLINCSHMISWFISHFAWILVRNITILKCGLSVGQPTLSSNNSLISGQEVWIGWCWRYLGVVFATRSMFWIRFWVWELFDLISVLGWSLVVLRIVGSVLSADVQIVRVHQLSPLGILLVEVWRVNFV